MSLVIRDAAAADMEELQGIFGRASLFNENDREYLLAHPDSMVLAEAPIREGRTRVAVDSRGGCAGFASYLVSGAVVELHDLFVDPPWMRRGVGRALVLDMLTLVRKKSFDTLHVTANPHAITFYENMGFVVDHVVDTEFYPAPRMHRRTS